jgi:Chondroitinase B
MIEQTNVRKQLSVGLAVVIIGLSGVSLSVLRSSSSAQGSSQTAARAKSPTSTRPSGSVSSANGAANPYRNVSVPALPLGVGPLPTDVGPSAPGRPKLPAVLALRTQSVSSLDELRAALVSAKPGLALQLEDGNYEGALVIEASGTAQAPLIIRSKRTHGAVFRGASSLRIQGQYVTIQDFKFVGTGAKVIDIAGLGARVTGNVFENCGDGESGSTSGLIFSDNPSESDPDGLRRPIIERKTMIDGNLFIRPKNTVIWQNHGLTGNSIIGNEIQGPHEISGGETEAIKIGFGFGAEPTNTTIAYNEIANWDGWPYVIGIKSSNVTLRKNLIGQGRVEVRYGNSETITDNVILNGDLVLGGDKHVVERNMVVSSTAKDRLGPLVIVGTATMVNEYGTYDGVSGPFFYKTLTNSSVKSNTFVSLDAQDAGTAFLLGLGNAVWSAPAKGNQFTENVFARTSGPNMFLGSAGNPPPPEDLLVANNTWSKNIFMCSNGCSAVQVKAPGLLGINGNTAVDGTRASKIGAGVNATSAAKSAKPAPTTRAKVSTTLKRPVTTRKSST